MEMRMCGDASRKFGSWLAVQYRKNPTSLTSVVEDRVHTNIYFEHESISMVFEWNTIPEGSMKYSIDSMQNIANKQIRQVISMHIHSNISVVQLWERVFVDSKRERYLMRPTQKSQSIVWHYCAQFPQMTI